MKAGRKRQVLTEKEAPIMQMLWEHGPMFVREMVELYDEPRPHFNTVSTQVRILEEKGIARKEDFRNRSLAGVIRDYFDNSYKNVVSALAEEEKISVDELREIIELVERKNNAKKK